MVISSCDLTSVLLLCPVPDSTVSRSLVDFRLCPDLVFCLLIWYLSCLSNINTVLASDSGHAFLFGTLCYTAGADSSLSLLQLILIPVCFLHLLVPVLHVPMFCRRSGLSTHSIPAASRLSSDHALCLDPLQATVVSLFVLLCPVTNSCQLSLYQLHDSM